MNTMDSEFNEFLSSNTQDFIEVEVTDEERRAALDS